MKNFFVACVTIALLYLGYDAWQPPPPPPPPPARVATPAPVAAPKVYFHSALDAPAMKTRMSTGTSYFSTDPESRFGAGPGIGASGYNGSYLSGPTYVVVPGGGAVAPTSTSPLGAAVQASQTQGIFHVRRETPRATPNPGGTAR